MESEVEFSSDILQPIPFEEWPLLQELLKVDWPRHSHYYYWVLNSIKWKRQDPDLALQIYCPEGNYQDDVTFVGISSFSTYDVYIFTNDLCGKRLHEALVRTNRIDWSRQVTFIEVHKYIQPILSSALAVLQTSSGIEIDTILPTCFYIKPAEECANVQEIKVPEEYYLGNLNLSHLPLIHSLWPRTKKEEPENSMKLLQTVATLNKGIGLFLKRGDVLVSWVLHNEYHGLGVVQTLESYKRRGFSKIVINALAKQLGEEGISPVMCIKCGNTASENMAKSLNWRPTVRGVNIVMKKQVSSVNEQGKRKL